MKLRAPEIVSAVGVAAILAMRIASCSQSAVVAGVLTAGDVGFTPSSNGLLALRSADGKWREELRIGVEVDGLAAPIDFGTSDGGFGAAAAIDIDGQRYEAHVGLATTEDSLAIRLDVAAQGSGEHEIALRLEGPESYVPIFASGSGEIADAINVETRVVVLESDPRPIAIASKQGFIASVESGGQFKEDAGVPLRFVARSRGVYTKDGGAAEMRIGVGKSSADTWTHAWSALSEPSERVFGQVTGAKGLARVIGLEQDGSPAMRFITDADGKFDVRAPRSVVRWYAGQDVTRTSAPAFFVPGSSQPLVLDLSEGGELVVHVVDPDTHTPLTARLFVHGIEGTLDPSFGPDYRASGAGPLIDALRGEVSTPLPSGRYRVSATKGIEWSVDAREIEIKPGNQVAIDLSPRHVVATPGQVACDFHVHARPSFDSPVSPDDRVLSLVAAGIDFAVPTEHNIVGDYGPSIKALELHHELAFVPGVEVTTYQPFIGHFGVFPYPAALGVPPYKGTTAEKLFSAARRGNDSKRVLQVNHPRMGRRIGYFDFLGWERDGGKPPSSLRMDFDAIELMNGYDLATPEKIDLVLHDWFVLLSLGHRFVATGSSDSHRIQYTWAGYPRTFVSAPDDPVDVSLVTTNLKLGRAVVTSGPIVDFDVDGSKPGEELSHASVIHAHVRVRAAPWIDVGFVELWENGKLRETMSVPSSPIRVGPELGSLEEAQSRTIRFETTRTIEVGETATWIVAVVRGSRKLDDVLPFMPVVPMAVTNPVWVKGR